MTKHPRISMSVLLVIFTLCGAMRSESQKVDNLTFHGDNARLGWNASEKVLTPNTVSKDTFGKLWHAPLDGDVPVSPLLVTNLKIGGAEHDVVYAATDHNSVFALDSISGKVLWERKHLFEPLTQAQFTGGWFGPVHGILSTPVIDRKNGTLYVCTIRARGLRQHFDVWALDLTTGATKAGWPITLKGRYKDTPFVPGQVMQRGALIISNGWVYVPFGGRGDIPPWRGWLIGVNTEQPNVPQRLFCSSPESDGAGLWSGGGVSADDRGDFFASTGNGEYDFQRGGSNMSESVLRMSVTNNKLDFSRQKKDYYTPSNFKRLDDQDEYLGGATMNILPDQSDSSTPHLLFTGGKDGVAYLLNRDDMGGLGGEVQKIRLCGMPNAIYYEGIRSTSAYFDAGSAGRLLYVAGDQPGGNGEHGIIALHLRAENKDAPIQMTQAWTMKRDLNGPSSPIVTSNGSEDGLVWVVETNDGDHSSLLAFDALSGAEIYDSNKASAADQFNGGKRFTSPIACNGLVFIPANGVLCYGMKSNKAVKESAQ